MRFIYSVLILCCCLTAACTNSAKEDIQFPREETVKQEFMPLQGIANPMKVDVKFPFLMVQNSERNDSIFHIYDLRDYELKAAFGVRGEGPDEFVNPWLQNTQLKEFLISDQHKIYLITLDDQGQPISKEKKDIRFIEGAMNSAFFNDSLFVLNAMYLGPDLHVLSLQDEKPRKSRQVRNPRIMDPALDPDDGSICANATRVARSYSRKKQIDIMDIDLNLIKRLEFNFPTPPTITSENLYDIKTTYLTGYFGKKYLCVLFRGISLDSYFSDPHAHNNYLEVFDLDGNPIVRYRLEGIGTMDFVVDEETFTFYGIPNDGLTEDSLIVYKLTGLS